MSTKTILYVVAGAAALWVAYRLATGAPILPGGTGGGGGKQG